MRQPRRSSLLASYAPVGRSGDFSGSSNNDGSSAQTWTFACGLGWLYGIGICVGPFFGTGVGVLVPGGVLAGAGGGIGVVFGIGMGTGVVWGTGRGDVNGFGVSPPMKPPFADGLPRPGDLPSPAELARRATDLSDVMRARIALQARDFRMRLRSRRETRRDGLAFAVTGPRLVTRGALELLPDPRWK